MGDVQELPLMLLALGDVREQRYIAQDLARASWTALTVSRATYLVPGLAPVPDLAVPVALVDQFPHMAA